MHMFEDLLLYAGLCVGASIVSITSFAFYNLFLHPLRKYPGPRSWAATRICWALSLQSGHFHHKLADLHSRYGPVVRIAPNELSYIDAQAWQDIYGTQHGKPLIKRNTIWAKKQPGDQESILSADEAAHLRNRRALMGAFTDNAVSEHASVVESYVDLMVEKFRDISDAQGGKAIIDIVQWLNFLTFDISGALSFGEDFGSVKSGKAHPWVDISCNFGKGLILMASVNFFSPLDKILALVVPKSVRDKMEYHQQIAKMKVQQRLAIADRDGSQDYVGSIQQYNKEKGDKIPPEEIESNLTTLVFAGSETTGSALASIINQLIRHPETLRKASDEIRSAFDSEQDIKVSNVAHMEYLTAVIQEGIRLGPPAAIGMPRVVPHQGTTISGQWVPGGTHVSVSQYPAYRSPTNFTQPNDFIPARFTTPVEGDNMSVFEPFLVGRHKCIGQKLAWAEMRLSLARLLFAFDIAPAPGHTVSDFGEQKTHFFWEKGPLMLELRPKVY
ncbi:cytochrome P450 [Lophiotrema nucula]|uniref:Cytochrome P450 n=1 Tax=Lophiotrema nucula TaxID=690887 RepID=A0A6A5YGV2_9PLEO|nr:cytochrome P450 [Lophiotrema nucula]